MRFGWRREVDEWRDQEALTDAYVSLNGDHPCYAGLPQSHGMLIGRKTGGRGSKYRRNGKGRRLMICITHPTFTSEGGFPGSGGVGLFCVDLSFKRAATETRYLPFHSYCVHVLFAYYK